MAWVNSLTRGRSGAMLSRDEVAGKHAECRANMPTRPACAGREDMAPRIPGRCRSCCRSSCSRSGDNGVVLPSSQARAPAANSVPHSEPSARSLLSTTIRSRGLGKPHHESETGSRTRRLPLCINEQDQKKHQMTPGRMSGTGDRRIVLSPGCPFSRGYRSRRWRPITTPTRPTIRKMARQRTATKG